MSHPELAAWLAAYGYWAVAVGCFIEGETILILAGFAASQHHLSLPLVVAVAALAGCAGDQCCFWLGRRHGARVLARFPSVAAQAPRVHRLVERWDAAAAFGVRFVYGMRLAGPLLMGSSAMDGKRFALFNALGALTWAASIAGLGWLFGAAVEALLGDLQRVELALFIALAVAAVVVLGLLRRRRRRGAPPG